MSAPLSLVKDKHCICSLTWPHMSGWLFSDWVNLFVLFIRQFNVCKYIFVTFGTVDEPKVPAATPKNHKRIGLTTRVDNKDDANDVVWLA